jgi:hypothetical protein
MSRAKFWMVLGEGMPCYRHQSKQAARDEAERLARLNPGEEFTVLEAVETVVKSDVKWEPNEIISSPLIRDQIPF